MKFAGMTCAVVVEPLLARLRRSRCARCGRGTPPARSRASRWGARGCARRSRCSAARSQSWIPQRVGSVVSSHRRYIRMPIAHTSRPLDAPSHEREHAGLLVGAGGRFHLRAEDAGHRASSSSIGCIASKTAWTSSGSRRSSPPVARARSHAWTTRSGAPKRSMACSNVCFPIMPSNSAVATAGSSSAAWTASRAFAHAPAGSSSTEGPGGSSLPDEAQEQLPVVDHVAHDVTGDPVVAGRRTVPAVGRHRVDPFGERCGDATETVGDLGHARDCTRLTTQPASADRRIRRLLTPVRC